MPPRYTYWTIILDGQPTAFRAADRESLLPTLKQLQSRNPGATLKWFARGRVWESPEEARSAAPRGGRNQREGAHGRNGASGNAPVGRGFSRAGEGSKAGGPPEDEGRRGKGWRPGGEHKDPREKFKKETFQALKRREKKAAALGRGESRVKPLEGPPRDRDNRSATPGSDRPKGGWRDRDNRGAGPRSERPKGGWEGRATPPGHSAGPGGPRKPWQRDRPQGGNRPPHEGRPDWRNRDNRDGRPPGKWSDRDNRGAGPRSDRPKGGWRDPDNRGAGPRSDRPKGGWEGRAKPPGHSAGPGGPRKPWQRERPQGGTRPPREARPGWRDQKKQGERPRDDRPRDDWRQREARGRQDTPPSPPDTPRPVIPEPKLPPEPERQPAAPEEPPRPSRRDDGERIRILPEPPEQGTPPEGGGTAPAHKTRMPRLRKR